jgi:hypothetical protein
VRAKRELPTARLIERRDLTPDLMVIRLEPEIPYTFTPGQYCTIGVEGIERAYSMVSSPHEPCLELFVELVPHGALTPRLWSLRLGDPIPPSSAEGGLHPPGALPLAPHGGDGHGHRAVREHAPLHAPSWRPALPLPRAAGRELPGRVAYRAELQAAAADHLRAECEPPRGRAQPRLDGLSAA